MATIASSLSALSSGGNESNRPHRQSKLLSSSLASSGSALASLALAPLVGMQSVEGNVSNTSLGPVNSNSDNNTPTGESSNIIIGPNGVLIPRSSILLNPSKRKTFVDQWRTSSQDGEQRPAPAVLRIAALPTSKDRQKQREQDKMQREREIEREVREKAQTQKVWGIPKKAFYLGLGEVNFNAQMAMLGGWGNGSADVVPLTTPARRKSTSSLPLKKKRRDSSATLKGKPPLQEHPVKASSERRPASESNKDGSESDTSIDLEELAQLNAIINTRRSMEAAQNLASGLIVRPLPPLKRNPDSQELNGNSHSSIPSTAGVTSSDSRAAEARQSEDLQRPSQREIPDKVHFAPLPVAYGAGTAIDMSNDLLDANTLGSSLDDRGRLTDDDNALDDESLSDEDMDFDGDESSSRRWSGGKYSKLFMMGMSKGMFTPQYYRPTRRPASTVGSGEGAGGDLSSSPLSLKLAPGLSNAQAENSLAERRGRRSKRPTSSRASSVKSRSSSVGSIDEDERERRRQLLRASRPGGTGMLTLPDGTKIRARRVGERYSDEEDTGEADREDLDERMSMDDASVTQNSVQVGDKRASDDEAGRESDGSDKDDAPSTASKRRRRNEVSVLQDSPEQAEAALEMDPPSIEKVVSTPSTDAVDKQDVQTTKGVAASLEPLESVTANGDQLPLRSVQRSVTMPVGRPVPLSATQAAEMRRRHEKEVGALEAEVLHNIAKAKKAKQQEQQQQQQAQLPGHQRHASENRQQNKQETPHPLPSDQVDRGRSKTKARRSQTSDERKGLPVPATLFKSASIHGGKVSLSPLQSSTRSTSRQHKGHAPLSSPTDVVPERPETPIEEQFSTLDDGGPRTPMAAGADTAADEDDINGLTTSVSSLRTLKGVQRVDVDGLTSSPSNGRTASYTYPDRPSEADVHMPDVVKGSEAEVESQTPLHRSSSPTKSVKARMRQRLPDLPSPLDLPRKPDMRGYSVVPLPVHQLGRRPLRPREGRFWESDEEVEDEEEEEEEEEGDEDEEEESTFDLLDVEKDRTKKAVGTVAQMGDDSDSDESDMDAEQLAEEERRTALQKKRATTRAAGAELVSGLNKHKSSNGGNRTFGRSSSNVRAGSKDRSRRQELSRSRSSTSLNRTMPISGAEHSSVEAKTSLRPTLSTSVLSTSLDKKGNPVAKISRRRDTWNDFDDEHLGSHSQTVPTLQMEELELSDGDDLWPPTLDNALGGRHSMSELHPPPPSSFTRPHSFRRMGSNASNLSSSSSLKHASSPTNVQLAMHAAKARAVREKREKEARVREKAKVLADRQNDESIDYGWPRSLQGSSLY